MRSTISWLTVRSKWNNEQTKPFISRAEAEGSEGSMGEMAFEARSESEMC